MIFFAQMREPDDVKVEGMMKYKTYTWDLVHALSQHSLPPARHQLHPLNPSVQSVNHEETKKILKKAQTTNKSYCIALAYVQRTQG